jgi:hypothetical protein
MLRRARILPALAAAGLLATGCEFLDNLTEDKVPETASLLLVVRDDWTGDSLPRATCTADHGKLSASADLEGRIAFAEVPTGSYSVVCGANSYFDRKATVQVKAGAGGSSEVRLARKPGAEWYPGQQLRWVSIQGVWPDEDVIVRNDLNFKVEAYPRDDRKTFEYRYTVALGEHPDLDSGSSGRKVSPTVDDADWWVHLPKVGPSKNYRSDTIFVTVSARLGDMNYVVGSESTVVSLRGNIPPRLQVIFNRDNISLCNESIQVGVIGEDVDGSCSLKFSNINQYSPLGRIDTSMPCTNAVVSFKLKNQTPVAGQVHERSNTLNIIATDDLGAVTVDSIAFKTLPNHLPEVVEFKAMTAPASAVAGAVLSFRASLRDVDNAIDNIRVDWGDSKEELVYAFTGVGENEIVLSLTHAYTTPGNYTATLKVKNPCGGGDITANLAVAVNPPP